LKLHLLIDTSVWLDLVKDTRQLPVLKTIPALIKSDRLELILPQIVVDEFNRNSDRIVADSRRSLTSHFKQVREAVSLFGDEAQREALIQQLREIDHRIALGGESVPESLGIIDELFRTTAKTAVTATAKFRAADRGLNKHAPFHRQRNSMADAILLEIYVDALASRKTPDEIYGFVTHNTQDFSESNGDSRQPHADIAGLFDGALSRYVTNLGPLMADYADDLVEDMRFLREYSQEPRRLSELFEAEDVLFQQVWYNRKWGLIDAVERGRTKVVSRKEYEKAKPKDQRKMIVQDIWDGMHAGMRKMEEELGKKNLGPWSDFEWGMINGKLSALRWVLGDDWDMLDT